MRIFFLSLLFISQAFAIDVEISFIDEGKNGETPLLFLSNGKVARIKNSELAFFQQAHDQKIKLRLELNQSRSVVSVHLLPTELESKTLTLKGATDYRPSVLSSLEVARSILNTGRKTAKEKSQCYNRAQVWAFEWFQKFGLNSEKTFIFFTRKYIRKFNFEWWFHVAPSVQVIEEGVVRQRIMDVKYNRAPLRIRNWTNIFLRNDAACPVISTYSDYANFPETGWCYVMTVPMYYYQPIDIETLETEGVAKEYWFDSEVSAAYLEAFEEVWPASTEAEKKVEEDIIEEINYENK